MTTTPFDDNATETERDLYESLRALLPSTSTVFVELTEDEDLPQFGVWVDDDIIGSGDSPSEALEEAIATARKWP